MKFLESIRSFFQKILSQKPAPNYTAVYLGKKNKDEVKKKLKNDTTYKDIFFEGEDEIILVLPEYLLSKDFKGIKGSFSNTIKILNAEFSEVKNKDYDKHYAEIKKSLDQIVEEKSAESVHLTENDAKSKSDEGQNGIQTSGTSIPDSAGKGDVPKNACDTPSIEEIQEIESGAKKQEIGLQSENSEKTTSGDVPACIPEFDNILQQFKEQINDSIISVSKRVDKLADTMIDEDRINSLILSNICKALDDYSTKQELDCTIEQKLEFYVKTDKMSTVETSLKKLQEKINSIYKDIQKLSRDKVDASVMSDLSREVEELKHVCKKLVADFEKSENGEFKKKAEELTIQLKQKESDLEMKQEELKKSKEENTKQQEEINEANKEIQSLTESNAEKDKTISKQASTLTAKEKALKKTTNELDSANRQIEEKDREIQESQGIISQQKEKILQQSQEKKEKDRRLNEQSQNIIELENDKKHLQIDLEKETEEKNNYEKVVHDDNEKFKNDFLKALSDLTEILNGKGIILPCGDNEEDCEELEEMLIIKVKKFTEKLNSELKQCNSLLESEEMLTKDIESELLNDKSWIYSLARYYAYSRKRFMKDQSREYGVRLDKKKINLMWENLNKMLSMLDFSLILPDIFEDSVYDDTEYEDYTGQTISNLDFLVPNNDKHLAEISDNDGGIIRDFAEIGYKYRGVTIKQTKIIR